VPRVSAKAVIVRDGKLLAIAKRDDAGEWYLLPGGGQDMHESLHEAVRRECREELGADVIVGELLYVRDYIARHHEFAAVDDAHQVELMFACTLVGEPGVGTSPDAGQLGVAWLPIDRLDAVRLYPAALKALLTTGVRGYLGDVN
jgi:ADP-ribose pyrophosphatase YjhB (NUDIX family)